MAAFVMKAAAAHIESLDAARRRAADGFVIAFADQEIIFDQFGEGRQRHEERRDRRLILAQNFKGKPLFDDRQIQSIGAGSAAIQGKAIAFQKIENRNLTLMLHFGRIASDGTFIEFYLLSLIFRTTLAGFPVAIVLSGT